MDPDLDLIIKWTQIQNTNKQRKQFKFDYYNYFLIYINMILGSNINYFETKTQHQPR